MAALDFPSSPVDGQVYTANGVNYVYSSARGVWANGVYTPPSFRNVVINGDFSIDQRNNGSSITHTFNAATKGLDRWTVWCEGASPTSQRVAGAASEPYAWRFTGATGNTKVLPFTKIEAADVAHLKNKQVVLSFRCKSTSLTSLMIGALYANSVDNFGGTTTIAGTTITINNTLTQYSFTFNAGANIGNGLMLSFETAGLGNGQTFELEAVQVEEGSVASAFERTPYTARLIRCQRYYQSNTSGDPLFCGHVVNGGTYFHYWPLPVRMRAAPTVVLSDLGVSLFPAGAASLNAATRDTIGVWKNANATATTNSGYYAWGYTADAEL